VNWLEPVTLEGRFIRLEPLDPARHAEAMFKHFDARVMEYLSRGKRIETAADFETHLHELIAIPNRINWAVRVLEKDAVVPNVPGVHRVAGRISYSEVKPSDGWLEIGTMLMPAFWGGAANPEGKLLLMTRAFEVLGATRVQFKVDERNARSQAAMVKLGAVREGVLRKYQRRPDGYQRDSVIFSVLDTEWPDVKRKLEDRILRLVMRISETPSST
jgi:RimJ/RimL family protein N-acetyltransferase